MPPLIPITDTERIEWAENFEIWFPPLGADLGFTAAEITAQVNDAKMIRYVIEDSRNAAAHSKAKTAYKNAIRRHGGRQEHAQIAYVSGNHAVRR